MALPFIQEVAGKFFVSDEAKETLSGIQGKIAVICVAGPYRTGKSYLLNSLIGCGASFSVGQTTRACTKGIWLWGKPIVDRKTGVTYLFLDTEGLGSVDQNNHFDVEIFSLALLLSSMFILNTQGTINEGALEQLELVVECSKRIRVSESDNRGELRGHFPEFLWVLRDFVLDMVDGNGLQLTSKQYLEACLAEQGGRHSESKTRIRDTIKEVFPTRDCFTLVRPVTDEQKLRKLQTVKPCDIRPEFTSQLEQLKARVVGTAKPKTLSGCIVNGPGLLGLAVAYTEAMNSGGMPTISSAWDSVVEVQCHAALDSAMAAFSQSLNKATQDRLLEHAEEEAALKAAQKAGLDVLRARALGDEEKKAMLEEDFACKSGEVQKQWRSINSLRAREANQTLIAKLWTQSGIEARWASYSSMADFTQDRASLTELFLSKARGAGKEEVAERFLGAKCDSLGLVFSERARSLQAELAQAKQAHGALQATLDRAAASLDAHQQEARARSEKADKANAALTRKVEEGHAHAAAQQQQIASLTQQLHSAAITAKEGDSTRAARIVQLEAELAFKAQVSAERDALKQKLAESNTKLKDVEATVAKLEKKLQQSEKKLALIDQRQAKDLQDRQQLVREFEEATGRAEGLAKANAQLTAEAGSLKKQVAEKAKEAKELHQLEARLEQAADSDRQAKAAVEKQLEGAVEQARAARQELAEAREASVALQRRLDTLSAAATHSAAKAEELEGRLEESQAHCEVLQEKLKATHQELVLLGSEASTSGQALAAHAKSLASLTALHKQKEVAWKAREAQLSAAAEEKAAAALAKSEEAAELAERVGQLEASLGALAGAGKQQRSKQSGLQSRLDELTLAKQAQEAQLVRLQADLAQASAALAEARLHHAPSSARPQEEEEELKAEVKQEGEGEGKQQGQSRRHKEGKTAEAVGAGGEAHKGKGKRTGRGEGGAEGGANEAKPARAALPTASCLAEAAVPGAVSKLDSPTQVPDQVPACPEGEGAVKKGSVKITITPGKRKQGKQGPAMAFAGAQPVQPEPPAGPSAQWAPSTTSTTSTNTGPAQHADGKEDKENQSGSQNVMAEVEAEEGLSAEEKHKRTVEERRRRQSLKVPRPEELADPAKKTVKDLKAWLTQLDVELPTVTQNKQFYLDLLYKYEPALEGRQPAAAPKRAKRV